MIIIIIKIVLVILSIGTVGILPVVALINLWIWNNVIVGYVLSSAIPIESLWIMIGLTLLGGTGISTFINSFKNKK